MYRKCQNTVTNLSNTKPNCSFSNWDLHTGYPCSYHIRTGRREGTLLVKIIYWLNVIFHTSPGIIAGTACAMYIRSREVSANKLFEDCKLQRSRSSCGGMRTPYARRRNVLRTNIRKYVSRKERETNDAFQNPFTTGFIKRFTKTKCSSKTKRVFLLQYSRAFRVRLPFVQLGVLRPISVFCEQLDFDGGATVEYPATSRMLIYSLVEWGIQAMVLIRGRISLYSGQIFPEMNITLLGEIVPPQRFYEVDLDESHRAQYLNQTLGSRVKLQCQ